MDECMLSMKQVAEIPDDVANDMLQAGGEIIAEAQRRKITATLLQPSSGILAKSVTVTPKMKRRKGEERYVTVYPKGTHHTYMHKATPTSTPVQKIATNNEVFFINEYGAPLKEIAGKGIARAANEESAEAVDAAMFKVYDKFLESKGL